MWREENNEGQTSVDFLVGVSIFSVTLLFVLQLAAGSVVDLSPETQTEAALADRTGDVLLSNWSTDAEPRLFENDTAEYYLSRSDTKVAKDLNIPKEGGNYLYRYNVTVVDLGDISEKPPAPIQPGSVELTAGNSTAGITGSIAGTSRVAYMNETGSDGEMVAIRVKVW
jgi:hypothetical protein